MACSHCGNDRVFAKGYCQGCYNRLRRKGTLERTNVVNTGKCSICGDQSHAKNLCARHYQESRHPLSWLWRNLRSRNPGRFPETWERFEVFLADVGERPTDRHQLRRLDESKSFSKENVAWKAPIGAPGTSTTKEYARRWQLQKSFGMTLEEYQRRFELQNGRCIICEQVETVRDRKGRIRPLAVDHDHGTNGVRDLLCNRCNHLLGLVRDNVTLLRAAIAYLERHAVDDSDKSA